MDSQFIIYAIPSGRFGAQVDSFFFETLSHVGRNIAHNFMPHVTLTNFFSANSSYPPSFFASHLRDAITSAKEKNSGRIPMKSLEFTFLKEEGKASAFASQIARFDGKADISEVLKLDSDIISADPRLIWPPTRWPGPESAEWFGIPILSTVLVDAIQDFAERVRRCAKEGDFVGPTRVEDWLHISCAYGYAENDKKKISELTLSVDTALGETSEWEIRLYERKKPSIDGFIGDDWISHFSDKL
ncbi:Ubiquitin-associated and SH3 domain-containing protein B [Nowakowskiella sp. JEL0407]|nr:Ubiquitin-associated and SH3 domain-containing protein B [Nowakowskiella sp. JEL0407]